MSASDVTRRWAEAVNRHDAAAMAELYAPNAVSRDPAYVEPLEGADAIRKDMENFLTAFPDLAVDLRTVVEANGDYAVESTFSGTHQGPFITPDGDIPPSGKRFQIAAAGLYRLDGQGRILDERRYYDMASLTAQLAAD